MSVGIVDQFEAVKVDKHDAQPLLPALGLNHGKFEAVLEQYPIGQAGQEIMEGLESNGFFCFFAFGNVARHAGGADKAAQGRIILGGIDAL